MRTRVWSNIISIFLSIITTFIISSVLLFVINKNPFVVFGGIFSEVFFSGYGLGQTLFKTTPLIICGCGLAICFHASLFNIGAEGQLNIGAFVLSISAYYFRDLPIFVLLPLCIIIGFFVSGIVGLIPAYIKIKKGVSEVISTIMLNFIILALINYLLLEFFAVKASVHTQKIPDSVMLTKFSSFWGAFEGSSLNTTFIFAIALAVITYIFIYRTNIGYKIRAVGFNELASKYIGISVNKIYLLSFFLGAGLTSLVGINFTMGYKGYYEFGFSNNLGFTAIAVTLLAKNNPIGIIFSAFLFGMLDYGGLAVNNIVPKEIMLVVQGIIILSIILMDKLVGRYFLKSK